PVIWVCFERSGVELLQQPAGGIAVGAQAALFDYHVALFIELAQHGMKKTLGLQIGPQLQPIRGQRVVIGGLVVIGEGVEILAAALLDDLAKLVGHNIFVGFGNGVLPAFFELFQFGLVAAHALVALRDVGGVCGLNLFQRRL